MSFKLPVKDPCKACALYTVSNKETGFCSQCQEDLDDERKSLNEGIDWFEDHFGVPFERETMDDGSIDIEFDLDTQLSDEIFGAASEGLSRYREGHE